MTVSCAEGDEGFIYEGEADYVATTANTELCPKKRATTKAAPNWNFFVVIPLSTNPYHFPMLPRPTGIMHMTLATAVAPVPMRMPGMSTIISLSECGTRPIEKGDCQRHPEDTPSKNFFIVSPFSNSKSMSSHSESNNSRHSPATNGRRLSGAAGALRYLLNLKLAFPRLPGRGSSNQKVERFRLRPMLMN